MGFGAYSVRISQLPDISEKILPVWNEMRDRKKHKCIICGEKRLRLERYADHMAFTHLASLENPVLEEYEMTRALFVNDHENSTEEELKTAYCDYDSETGKRYSEDESGEDSNSEDEYNHRKEKSPSESNLSSGSSSEDSAGSH